MLRAGWASRTPARIMAALGIVTCTLSLWLSNTTITTPPNAIVYGSGLVPLPAMARSGIILDIVGAGLI